MSLRKDLLWDLGIVSDRDVFSKTEEEAQILLLLVLTWKEFLYFYFLFRYHTEESELGNTVSMMISGRTLATVFRDILGLYEVGYRIFGFFCCCFIFAV